MAQNQGTHNQPSREAQIKGGQHSHQGSEQHSGNRTPPTREEASKAGQHSHAGGNL